MKTISGMLITVRTSEQGAAMEKGKMSPEYKQEISTLSVSPEDYAALQITEKSKVKLKSASGEIEVMCKSQEGPRNIFFLPLGPLANELIDAETDGTGVPKFKAVSVTIETIT